jgi:hypothetical protein
MELLILIGIGIVITLVLASMMMGEYRWRMRKLDSDYYGYITESKKKNPEVVTLLGVVSPTDKKDGK